MRYESQGACVPLRDTYRNNRSPFYLVALIRRQEMKPIAPEPPATTCRGRGRGRGRERRGVGLVSPIHHGDISPSSLRGDAERLHLAVANLALDHRLVRGVEFERRVPILGPGR